MSECLCVGCELQLSAKMLFTQRPDRSPVQKTSSFSQINIEGVSMESIDGPFSLQFLKIESSQVYLGTNKGGWVYASERPMHRVELPSFMIMKDPMTEKQFAEILGKKNDSSELRDMVTNDEVQLICETLSSHFEDEVRRPTQSEWKACEELLNLPCGWTELLSDEATGNHRGANLDGRPRTGEMIGPLSGHRVSQSAHPTKENVYFCVNTPGDRPLPKVGFRLVVSPKREGEAPRVPDNANLITNVKSELFWTTILGIIPMSEPCAPIFIAGP